jgi:hypothetical protein
MFPGPTTNPKPRQPLFCSVLQHPSVTGALTTPATVGHPDAVDTGDIGLAQDSRHIATHTGAAAGGAGNKCAIAGWRSSTSVPCGIDWRTGGQCTRLARADWCSRLIQAGHSPCSRATAAANTDTLTFTEHSMDKSWWMWYRPSALPPHRSAHYVKSISL